MKIEWILYEVQHMKKKAYGGTYKEITELSIGSD